MRSTFAALALVLLAPFAPAVAQDGPSPAIVVTGEGAVDIAPDMATISLGVTSEADTAAAALKANNEKQAQVLAALAAAGIEPRDIQTSGLNMSPLWDNRSYSDGRPRITGYQVSNIVTVRVRKLDDLGGLLDAVVTTGANQLNSLTFGLEDDREAMDEARRRAVADAMAKAKLYAEAAGVSLGKVMMITENGGYQPPQPMFRRDAAMEAGVLVAGGELTVSSGVSITFAIGE